MKIGIVIYLQPQELDDFYRTALLLKGASQHINGENFHILVRLDTTHLTTPSTFAQDKFNTILPLLGWAGKVEVITDKEVRGVVSMRRYALTKDWTHHIWLDNDIIFPKEILYYITESIKGLGEGDYILSPETVRLWDTTWDCLVNENFMDKPINYCREGHDPYTDSQIYGDVQLEEVRNNIYGQPNIKFGGGWFNTLSTSLLKKVGIPQSFGHYGLEDTFIMWASSFIPMKQYKLKNIVVCEDYTFRNNEYWKGILTYESKKEEYLKVAHQNFGQELNKLKENYAKHIG